MVDLDLVLITSLPMSAESENPAKRQRIRQGLSKSNNYFFIHAQGISP